MRDSTRLTKIWPKRVAEWKEVVLSKAQKRRLEIREVVEWDEEEDRVDGDGDGTHQGEETGDGAH